MFFLNKLSEIYLAVFKILDYGQLVCFKVKREKVFVRKLKEIIDNVLLQLYTFILDI